MSCYWIEQRGVRESERAQNIESDKVIGFLATSHSCPALWLALCTSGSLVDNTTSSYFKYIQAFGLF